jgi:hypothetical protein
MRDEASHGFTCRLVAGEVIVMLATLIATGVAIALGSLLFERKA